MSENAVRSITRAVDLMNLFDHGRPFLTLREVVDASGLPKTTAVRLVGNLIDRNLLFMTPNGTYTLGAGLLRWVKLSGRLWEVSPETQLTMRELVTRLEETVNIYVRQDSVRVSIAQEQGTRTVRNVVEVGRPMPLWAGSAAKVLLQDAPEGVYSDLRENKSDLDVTDLKAQVELARTRGYSVSRDEREQGAASVSAPIRSTDSKKIIAALSVSGPTPRLSGAQLATAVTEVVAAAEVISDTGLGNVEVLL